MMKIYNNPDKIRWDEIIARPQLELSFLESTVKNILKRVKDSGDSAIRDLTNQLDKVVLKEIQVSPDEIFEAERLIDQNLKQAIGVAAANIRKFHEAQKVEAKVVET